MARERTRRPDLDEPFSLHPADPEDVLRRILGGAGADELDDECADDPEDEAATEQ
jgi:hypothetical protein